MAAKARKTALMRTIFPILCALCAAASAQPISAGLKLGVPLNEVTKVSGDVRSLGRQAAWGAVVELNLPANLAIEVNALTRRTGFAGVVQALRTNSWEFPMLLKIRKGGLSPVKPYVGAGMTFRRLGDALAVRYRSSTGLVFSGGLRINAIAIKVSPEIRYTRWNNEGLALELGRPGAIYGSKNQLEAMLGITF
jgi:hypothetical protein